MSAGDYGASNNTFWHDELQSTPDTMGVRVVLESCGACGDEEYKSA